MLNPNPTNPNRPTKKTIIKLKVKCNRKNYPRGTRTLTIQLAGKHANH